MLWSTAFICATAAVPLLIWVLLGRWIALKLLGGRMDDSALHETPQERGFDTIDLLISHQGKKIRGWLIHPPNQTDSEFPCVLMVHGFSSDKNRTWTFADDPDYRGSMMDQGAESLCLAGFAVAAIDLRNHGESDRNGFVTLGNRESEDVIATLEHLRRHHSEFRIAPNRIGLRGESMGAATCLIAAARLANADPSSGRGTSPEATDDFDAVRVAAIWCDSSFADATRVVGDFLAYKKAWSGFAPIVRFWLHWYTGLRLSDSSPTRYAADVDCPVAIVHSTGDLMVPTEHFRELESADWRHPATTWLLDNHHHNRLWKEPDYQARQIRFFSSHLS